MNQILIETNESIQQVKEPVHNLFWIIEPVHNKGEPSFFHWIQKREFRSYAAPFTLTMKKSRGCLLVLICSFRHFRAN